MKIPITWLQVDLEVEVQPTIPGAHDSDEEQLRRWIQKQEPGSDRYFVWRHHNTQPYRAARRVGAKVRIWKEVDGSGYRVWRVQ